jgi:hypothetical protein
MKIRIFAFVMSILFVTLACGLSNTISLDQNSVATVVAATLQSMANEVNAVVTEPSILPPAATDAPAIETNGIAFSFQNVSIVIPPGLANAASGEMLPEMNETNSGPWDIAPEHILITLTGYPLVREGYGPLIHIYPADQYFLVNQGGENSLTRLRAVLASPAAPLNNDILPTVPFYNAAQLYAAQAGLLKFQNGEGVRMISESAQYPAPIIRDLSYYHFEGLTYDGKFYIVALFPVIVPLEATEDNPSADGIPYPVDREDESAFTNYYQAITDRLNTGSPESFQPSLTDLDTLIQSIQIMP